MVPFELIQVFAHLQSPESRQAGLRALAAYSDTADAFLFGKDEEVGVYLPAQGLPQTMRHGVQWQAFLGKCATDKLVTGSLPNPGDGITAPAFGISDESGLAIIVFLGGEPCAEKRDQISALLPLIGMKLVDERRAQSAAGHAAAARNANEHARSLNIALDANRRELQKAFERAENELVYRREAEKKLREADRKKDEFLAMLAHELRNPLAPINMAAQIVKLSSAGRAQIAKASAIIDRQVKHMTSLLDDLLDVSRVTRGQITLEKKPTEIKTVVADAIEQARALIESREHVLTVQLAHEPAQVEGDRTRLVQIITNLLNNAAKFTPRGGQISLRLEVNSNDIVLTVRDNGIGIEQSLLPQIFELFTQAVRSSDRSQGGLGLGLALVKSLVELHNGAISARSEGLEGLGSEFIVRLPRLVRAPEPSQMGQELADASELNPSLRILIVDDNSDAADTLATFLEALGHQVQVAYHAREAIELARTGTPSVLILDIGLPDMDGLELARTFRSMPQTAQTKLIALTGYGQPNDQERAIAAGFNYHFTKPADPLKITELLTELSKNAPLTT